MIPLEDIWAYRMPGTRDVRALDRSLVNDIAVSLGFISVGQRAGKGFVVPGNGLDALTAAHAVLVKKRPAKSTFTSRDPISLVFYSHSFGYYVELQSVHRSLTKITVQYRLVPHLTHELTNHFALIPITGLSAGKIHVEVIELPFDESYVKQGFKLPAKEERTRGICRPFLFLIETAPRQGAP